MLSEEHDDPPKRMTTLPKRTTTTASRCCNRRQGWPASLRGGAAAVRTSRSCSSIRTNAISSSFNRRLACGTWPSWSGVGAQFGPRPCCCLPRRGGWFAASDFDLSVRLGAHDRSLALSLTGYRAAVAVPAAGRAGQRDGRRPGVLVREQKLQISVTTGHSPAPPRLPAVPRLQTSPRRAGTSPPRPGNRAQPAGPAGRRGQRQPTRQNARGRQDTWRSRSRMARKQ